MDIKDYISSEALELYAGGNGSEKDRGEIEQVLRQRPELRAELTRIKANGKTSGASGSAPRPFVLRTNSKHAAEAIARGRDLNPEHSVRFWQIATIAAVVLAFITCYMLVDFRSGLDASQAALREAQDRNQQLTKELNVARELMSGAQKAYDFWNKNIYSEILLSGTPQAPKALATVFWNRRTGEFFLTNHALPPLSPEMQYQMWIIDDQRARSAGTFSAKSGLLRMGEVAHASAFIITKEPAGGSVRPSPSGTMVVGKTGM